MRKTDKFRFIYDVPLQNAKAFNFDKICVGLHEFILNINDQTPFCICIDGGWGSGKTSLLLTLREMLGNTNAQIIVETSHQIQYIPIWFEPWKLTNESEILNAMVNHVLRQIEQDANLFASAQIEINRKDALRLLSQRFLQINPDELSSFYQWSNRMKGSFYEIEDLFRRVTTAYLNDPNQKRIFVVFIDDLDRCPPSRVIAVLEAIKLFFNIQGFIFVVGIDKSQIIKSIMDAYKNFTEFDAKVYLEKIFQMVYTLPIKDEGSLIEFVSNTMSDMGLTIQEHDLLLALVETYGRNLRNLKIFLNGFNFQRYIIMQPGIALSDEILFKWLYLEYKLPSTLNYALQKKILYILVAIEFLAKGCLLFSKDRRNQYIQFLSSQRFQYFPLLITCLFSIETFNNDIDIKTLDKEYVDLISLIRNDGSLIQVIQILGKGKTFFIDQDLSNLAYLTRREEFSYGITQSRQGDDFTQSFGPRGFFKSALEWDKIGDKLYSKGLYQESCLAYLIALNMEYENFIYWTDLGTGCRRLGLLDVAKSFYKRGYGINSQYIGLLTQIGFLFDVDYNDEEISSLFYRKCILLGVKGDSVPYNLSKNMHTLGDTERAYYYALKSFTEAPEDDLNRKRLLLYAKDAGRDIKQEDLTLEYVNQILEQEQVREKIEYHLSEEEEEKIKSILDDFPDFNEDFNIISLIFQ